eukprot:Rhum_TRINITY_DN14656_c10_g3::Rhum_TRINITY_DN14656_c10_g3_i1::g.107990::m.107990
MPNERDSVALSTGDGCHCVCGGVAEGGGVVVSQRLRRHLSRRSRLLLAVAEVRRFVGCRRRRGVRVGEVAEGGLSGGVRREGHSRVVLRLVAAPLLRVRGAVLEALRQEGVLQELRGRRACLVVHGEAEVQHVVEGFGDLGGERRYRVVLQVLGDLEGNRVRLFQPCVPGRPACRHFDERTPKGPDVRGEGVVRVADDLWRKEQNSPADARRADDRRVVEDLRRAKVGELAVAILVHKDVVALHVPVHDVAVVQVLQPRQDLRRVPLDGRDVQAASLTPELAGHGRKRPTRHVLHEDVHVLWVPLDADEADDVRVVQLLQHVDLPLQLGAAPVAFVQVDLLHSPRPPRAVL